MANQFRFYAYVHFPKFVRVLSFASFGVWKEISQSTPVPDGTLTELKAQFENMKRPSPMNFSWIWTPDTKLPKTLFQTLSSSDRLTVELRISMLGENNNSVAGWRWDFYDVGVIRSYPYKKYMKVETHFSKFYPNVI